MATWLLSIFVHGYFNLMCVDISTVNIKIVKKRTLEENTKSRLIISQKTVTF